MTLITLAGRSFVGPHDGVERLSERPGVYLVLHGSDRGYRMIDVGQAEAVRTRLSTHERRASWERHCGASPFFAVLYMPWSTSGERRVVEAEIRSQNALPFGEEE